MKHPALKELLFKIADDQLIMGHRNSEWTGMGPLLEEDIAFSSMAQDKVGQSHALYALLGDLGEDAPDIIAFTRQATDFHNAQLCELPNGEYDFSLVRHFFFDIAEYLRFAMLAESSHTPLAQLAKKVQGELRYHVMHATTWITQLGNASEESVNRLQHSLNKLFPFALGLFEPSPWEDDLISERFFAGEAELQRKWLETVIGELEKTQLVLPEVSAIRPVYGGREGKHTEHLQPLLEEMGEVFRIDPEASW